MLWDYHPNAMLVLNRGTVEALLDMDQLIDRLAPAMASLSAGTVSLPPRVGATVPDSGGTLASMPAYVPSPGTLATKLISLFPGNAGTGIPTHQALVALFDPANGSLLAVMDGTHITAVRTGACSALATRMLARGDAGVMAVLGTGVQAQWQIRAVPRVRSIREVRIAGRDPEKARALARGLSGKLGIPIHAAESYREALAGADIVCAATHSPDPVVRWEWLGPGVHVNSVGLNHEGREVDQDTVVNSLVVVESRQAVLGPAPGGANDLKWPIRDGLMTEDHIHAELGELVSGARPGRTNAEQVTLYKSVGVAVQDAVAASLVLAAARERGLGVEIDL